MFLMKVRSNLAGFTFLDLILFIRDSVHRPSPNYCNKNPPDTPNIPTESLSMNPDLNALLTYKLTLERKAVLAAQISFLIWDQNKATTTYFRRTFLKAVRNVYWARATEIGYRAVTKRLALRISLACYHNRLQ